jgi:hypothetical protein
MFIRHNALAAALSQTPIEFFKTLFHFSVVAIGMLLWFTRMFTT